jgi:hypothetical protein
MAKGDITIGNGNAYYGVLQEVLELQYGRNKHGNRSVFLFRCDWYDLTTKGFKMKDDGFFKSVNPSVLWLKSAPFILAGQAHTCFYLDDTTFGDPWKVVQNYMNRDVYDVPENELGNDGAHEHAGYAFQEDIGETDHIIRDVDEEDDEDESEFQPDNQVDKVERVDARIICELAKEDNNEYVEVGKDKQVDTDEDDGPDFIDADSDHDIDDD